MEAVEHGTRDELAVGRLERDHIRVRVWNPVDALVDAGAVVPTVDALVDDSAKLVFVPDEKRILSGNSRRKVPIKRSTCAAALGAW